MAPSGVDISPEGVKTQMPPRLFSVGERLERYRQNVVTAFRSPTDAFCEGGSRDSPMTWHVVVLPDTDVPFFQSNDFGIVGIAVLDRENSRGDHLHVTLVAGDVPRLCRIRREIVGCWARACCGI